jgi:hypothetical protein
MQRNKLRIPFSAKSCGRADELGGRGCPPNSLLSRSNIPAIQSPVAAYDQQYGN